MSAVLRVWNECDVAPEGVIRRHCHDDDSQRPDELEIEAVRAFFDAYATPTKTVRPGADSSVLARLVEISPVADGLPIAVGSVIVAALRAGLIVERDSWNDRDARFNLRVPRQRTPMPPARPKLRLIHGGRA